MAAFWIQFWHHIEHGLLQSQAIIGENLFNSPVPVSILQLVIRRPELHLIYNAAVFIPMVIAMYHHLFPSEEEAAKMQLRRPGQRPRGLTHAGHDRITQGGDAEAVRRVIGRLFLGAPASEC